MAETWGEKADRGAPVTEAFSLLLELATKEGRIPVTKGLGPGQCWKRALADGWVIYLNGWQQDALHDGHKVLAFHALGVKDGMPLLLFGPFDGTQIGDGGAEDSLNAALRQAIAPSNLGGTDA